MAFRCLLFSSDGETATLISNVLAGLDVEADVCSEAVVSVEKLASQPFRIVIIDWDMQPEAGLLLTAARERKASDRPLTLAIVSDESSVPKALQAGANSILRRPIAIQQVKDTLKTARDLLRARLEPAPAPSAAAAAAGASASSSADAVGANSEPPRKGEFLQPRGTSTLFEVESDMQKSMEQSAASEVEALKELEPTAAAVQKEPAAPVPAPQASTEKEEPRGLEWFLKRSTGGPRSAQMAAAAPEPMPPRATPPAPTKPELIGFDQTPSYAPPVPPNPPPVPEAPVKASEEKTEAKLFAYMNGERPEPKASSSHFRLGKKSMLWAAALAICAIVAAPQAPWHAKVRTVWGRGRQTVHGWLNPQLVTTPQAPTSHESFARPGDEYKLPVAEPIPDATTDPSQIRVTPVIDPTAKKTNDGAVSPDSSAQPDGTTTTGAEAKPTDPFQSTTIQVQEQNAGQPATSGGSAPAAVMQPPASSAGPPQASAPVPANSANVAPAPLPAATALSPSTPLPAHLPSAPASAPHPAPTKNPQPAMVAADDGIPSSLRTQLAPSVPDLSGNKAPETAMDSIEPVVIPEAAARSLAIQQPAPPYPATARGQQGTVVLQVLIGRDGTVQDAKFLQGSLAFARNAIDGVRQWKFKPYIMNARPVMVQTQIRISFKPGS
jgi:protein TonB